MSNCAPEREEVVLLRQVLDELRALPSAIAAAVQTGGDSGHIGDHECASLVQLLAGISGAIGDRIFSARELIAHSGIDPALRSALERAVGGFDSRIARRIGKRLQRAEGKALQGYKVERVKTERTGALWRIVAPLRVSLPRHSRSA